jgi:hypothetical protein
MLASQRVLQSPPVELGEDGASTDERDWAVLASELEDELKQGRDNVPPDQYREAIDAYFRTLSGALAGSAPAP